MIEIHSETEESNEKSGLTREREHAANLLYKRYTHIHGYVHMQALKK